VKAWALVPVKGFDRGKSRLGGLLDDRDREALARSMFDRVVGEVLGALAAAGEIGGTLVVTDADEVTERARMHGARAMRVPPVGPGRKLGAIVDEGLGALGALGAEAALVIMGDLPSLEADDVRALAAALADHDLVLAPDAAGTGTNALGTRLPAPMPTRFCGGASLAAHLDDARTLGLRLAICARPGLGFDVDQPADYSRIGEPPASPASEAGEGDDARAASLRNRNLPSRVSCT
jgi:2-phospho-L-lactate guanylyltransferase